MYRAAKELRAAATGTEKLKGVSGWVLINGAESMDFRFLATDNIADCNG